MQKVIDISLQEEIKAYFKKISEHLDRKYVDPTPGNNLLFELWHFCNEQHVSILEVLSLFFEKHFSKKEQLLLEMSHKLTEINGNLSIREIPQNTFLTGITQFRETEKSILSAIKDFELGYQNKNIESLRYFESLRTSLTNIQDSLNKTFDSSKLNEAETVSASIETPQTAFLENIQKSLTQIQELLGEQQSKMNEGLLKVLSYMEESIQNQNTKSKTFDSSKLNEAETVSASIETPQTAFFENEKKLLDKFTQMQEDGFSSSDIMETLNISKEVYKKLLKNI